MGKTVSYSRSDLLIDVWILDRSSPWRSIRQAKGFLKTVKKSGRNYAVIDSSRTYTGRTTLEIGVSAFLTLEMAEKMQQGLCSQYVSKLTYYQQKYTNIEHLLDMIERILQRCKLGRAPFVMRNRNGEALEARPFNIG